MRPQSIVSARGRIGPLTVGIEGASEVVEYVRTETDPIADGKDPDLVLRFVPNIDPEGTPEYYGAKGNFHFSQNGYYFRGRIPHEVTHPFDSMKPMKVIARWQTPGPLERVRHGRRWMFGGDSRFQHIGSYAFLWYLVQLALMKEGASFLHSGIVATRDKVTALIGTGGCGKTSAVLKVMQNEGSTYFAEDFGIITRSGLCHPSPKGVTLYASDVNQGQEVGRRYVRNDMDPVGRTRWWLAQRRGRNPRDRVSPSLLFGPDRVASGPKKMTDFVFLRRSASTTPTLKGASVQDLAQRSAAVTGREMKTLYDILQSLNANAPRPSPFPDVTTWIDDVESIYKECFSHGDCYLLDLPHRWTPNETYSFLVDSSLV